MSRKNLCRLNKAKLSARLENYSKDWVNRIISILKTHIKNVY